MNYVARLCRELMGRRAVLACAAWLVFAAGGCTNGHSALPDQDAARSAVENALKSWHDGARPGTLAGTEPPVQVFDTPWSQGARLRSYEILRNDTTTAERRFNVRLSTTNPDRVQEVQYYVMGQSPLLVFRDEDYLRNINMEDGPKPARGARPASRRR